jgi:3-oxoacyl-[acyl-carrier-protein] synthase III
MIKMINQENNYGIGIIGVGKYIPEKLITNEQIEEWTGVTSQRIIEQTGIKQRYIIQDHESASKISAIAALQAIEMANVKPDDIKLIIGCTFSGDYVYPAMACIVQELIDAKNAGAFDILANCTSFQVGLTIAADRMKADPSISFALVLGTAVQSPYINWRDPASAMYFGDGAGAAILGRVPFGYGMLASEIFSNSKVYDAVRLRGGGSSYPLRPENIDQGLQYYEMSGMEVWKQVIQNQPKVIRRVLDKINKHPSDVDFFIFHQANLRLIEYLMGKMKMSMSKTYTNIAEIGNTADASIPIALCDAVRNNLIKRDNLIIISGVGAGFIFGAAALRWY